MEYVLAIAIVLSARRSTMKIMQAIKAARKINTAF
jgi:hypothetical protein